MLWQIMHIIVSDEYGMPFNHEGSRNLKDQTKPELKITVHETISKVSMCVPHRYSNIAQCIQLASLSCLTSFNNVFTLDSVVPSSVVLYHHPATGWRKSQSSVLNR